MNLTPYETALNELASGKTQVIMKGRLTPSELENLQGRIDYIASIEFSDLSDETLIVAGLSEYTVYDLHAAVDCKEITPDQMSAELTRRGIQS